MKFAAESVHGKFRRDAIFWGEIREIASRPLLLLSATMPSKSHNNGHVGGWCGVCVGGREGGGKTGDKRQVSPGQKL